MSRQKKLKEKSKKKFLLRIKNEVLAEAIQEIEELPVEPTQEDIIAEKAAENEQACF